MDDACFSPPIGTGAARDDAAAPDTFYVRRLERERDELAAEVATYRERERSLLLALLDGDDLARRWQLVAQRLKKALSD